jgi:hypothetical protein
MWVSGFSPGVWLFSPGKEGRGRGLPIGGN